MGREVRLLCFMDEKTACPLLEDHHASLILGTKAKAHQTPMRPGPCLL